MAEFSKKYGIPSSSPPASTPVRRDSRMPSSTPVKQEWQTPGKESAQEFTTGGSSSPFAPTSTQYTPHQLRQIGQQCGNRLPPASAVQAMFLYELQRESELESLFHGSIFRIAKQEDTSSAQAKRISALEQRLARFEKQLAAKDTEERLATSKGIMDVQQIKLNQCTSRVDTIEDKLNNLTTSIETLRTAQEDSTDAAAAATTTNSTADEDIPTMKEEIDVLFGDRDGILEMVSEIKDRLTKLEDNVRSLTLQNTALKSPSPTPNQALPLQSPSTNGLALGVPKGKAYVSLNNENRPAAASIRSFTPGTPWAT